MDLLPTASQHKSNSALPLNLYPDNEDSRFLWNTGNFYHTCTIQCPIPEENSLYATILRISYLVLYDLNVVKWFWYELIPLPEDQAGGKDDSKEVKKDKEMPMDVEGEDDYSEVMNDPDFLQSVLENLPGVDPQSEAIRQAVGSLSKDKKDRKDEDKHKSSKKW